MHIGIVDKLLYPTGDIRRYLHRRISNHNNIFEEIPIRLCRRVLLPDLPFFLIKQRLVHKADHLHIKTICDVGNDVVVLLPKLDIADQLSVHVPWDDHPQG